MCYEMSLCPPLNSKQIFHFMPSLYFAQNSHYYSWYENANCLNSHFLFLCASLYIDQPFFFLLNQSLVCEDADAQ